MVFVQHTLTQLYLQSFAEWTAELHEAWMFDSAAEAIRYCEMTGLTDVQVIVPSATDVQRITLPARDTAFMVPRSDVPIVLPRIDLRPN